MKTDLEKGTGWTAWFRGDPELGFFLAFLLFKVLFLHVGIGQGVSWGLIVTTLALLVLLLGWTGLLPPRARTWTRVAIDLVVTTMLIADLLFFRYYERVIPLPILYQAGQVQSVTDSLLELLSVKDVLLFSDFLFFLTFWRWWRLRGVDAGRGHVWQALGLTTLAAAVLAAQTGGLIATNGKGALLNLYASDVVLKRTGILGYHAVDLYNVVAGGGTGVSVNDQQSLKTWMDVHRKQGGDLLHGAAQGKNVIMIQMEALQNFLIGAKVNGQEVTPNLNRLVGSSIYFDHYFPQIGDGNTADAEFMSLNSIHPAPAGAAYVLKSDNHFQSLPKLMKDAGYTAYAFHGYKGDFYNREKMYGTEGFDKFFSEMWFKQDDRVGWGVSDESFYQQALPVLKRTQGPLFSFFLSLSGHHTYKIPDAKKGLKIPAGSYSELFTDYLQAQHYADQAFGEFLDGLKKDNLLDNAMLVLYGDHFGNGLRAQEIDKFLGGSGNLTRYQEHELKKVPLLIRLPNGQGAGRREISGGQMDLLPTLANLLGLDKSRMFYFGEDLLNSKEGYSVFSHYVERGSFATDKLFYVASKDGAFQNGLCYDRSSGQTTDLKLCEAGWKRGQWELAMSNLILERDGLPAILGDRMKSQR
jgi:lipoteichoic acid synthase